MPKHCTIVNAQFGRRMRQVRVQRGWSAQWLAGEAGVSRKTIARIENTREGQTGRFYTENLHNIAQALGTTLEDMLAYPTARPGTNQEGWLVQEGDTIFWVQHRKKYPVRNRDIIDHMKRAGLIGWSELNPTDSIARANGPTFYTKRSASNGLLIKDYSRPTVFVIQDGHRHQFADEYSFANYTPNGDVLSWVDIISVTEAIINEFPRGLRIELKPRLISPTDGVLLHTCVVSLSCQSHPNPEWNYHFQLACDRDFRQLLDEKSVAQPSVDFDSLSPGTYFWRSRGVKPGRIPSVWSDVRSFTITLADPV